MDSNAVTILSGGTELLLRAESLWLKLKQYHLAEFPEWSETLQGGKFSERVHGLRETAREGALLVELAYLAEGPIAFCISVIDCHGGGELASLYVDEACRQQGLGQRLVRSSLQWLNEHQASPIFVDVMAGNVAALGLYEGAGFVKRVHRLQWQG